METNRKRKFPEELLTLNDEDFKLKLIHAVRRHPGLYDTSMPEYSKRDFIELAWNGIAKELGESAYVCKERWRNLRSVFVRKLREEKGRKRKRKYYLEHELEFLTPFARAGSRSAVKNVFSDVESENDQQSSSSLGDFPTIEENVDIFSDVEDNTFHGKYVKIEPRVTKTAEEQNDNKKPASSVNNEDTMWTEIEHYVDVENPEEVEPDLITNEDDSRRMFLLSLLPDVRQLSSADMRIFRKKVLETLDSLLEA